MKIVKKPVRAVITVEKAVMGVVKAGGKDMWRWNVVAAVVDHALNRFKQDVFSSSLPL